MHTRFRLAGVVLTVAVVSLVACEAGGTSLGKLQMQYSNVTPGRSARLYFDGDSLGSIATGQYRMKVNTAFPEAWGEGLEILALAAPDSTIGAFCTDIVQWAPGNDEVYDVRMPEDGPVGGQNDLLFPEGMGATKALHLRRLFSERLSSVAGNNTAAAAFQLAVWEITFETADTYEISYYDDNDRGAFYAKGNDSMIILADEWLSGVISDTSDPQIRLRILTNPDSQDYSFILPDVSPENDAPVPEPVTVTAMMAGLVGLGGYALKRFKFEMCRPAQS